MTKDEFLDKWIPDSDKIGHIVAINFMRYSMEKDLDELMKYSKEEGAKEWTNNLYKSFYGKNSPRWESENMASEAKSKSDKDLEIPQPTPRRGGIKNGGFEPEVIFSGGLTMGDVFNKHCSSQGFLMPNNEPTWYMVRKEDVFKCMKDWHMHCTGEKMEDYE